MSEKNKVDSEKMLGLLRVQQPNPLQKITPFMSLLHTKENYINALLETENERKSFPAKIEKLVRNNAKLLNCEPVTLFDCIYTMALTGLDPNSRNEIFAIPYKDRATIQIGYKGWEKLALRDGTVCAITSQVVYTNDDFSVDLGCINKPITHKLPRGERGDFEAVYAQATVVKNGVPVVIAEVMTKKEVERRRSYAQKDKTGKNTFWDNHFDEMARKSVIKLLCKHLPLTNSRAIDTALSVEKAIEEGRNWSVNEETGEVVDVQTVSPLDAIRQAVSENESNPLNNEADFIYLDN